MKIPQIFLSNKNLETKIKHLLKKPKERGRMKEGVTIIDEAKQKFPKFIDFLLNLYPYLSIIKKENKGTKIEHQWTTWFFYDAEQCLGSVNTYNKNIGKRGRVSDFEHGYEGKIFDDGKWHTLKYREGYYSFNGTKIIATIERPYRSDPSEIPFP